MKNKVQLSSGVLYLLFLVCSSYTHAHGWSEYPNARQNICYEQGGIWSGSPPNAACAQAKAVSGPYAFVQRNEYSINVPDYTNIEAVKRAIPDGTLCYANDRQKKGMGSPRKDWVRTTVAPGKLKYIFNATTPHNPSFWEFYLTKASADLSKPLAWNDLELIKEVGDISTTDSKYIVELDIPVDRSGDAILFVRWQRDDPAGEGFYNCSDIRILGPSSVDGQDEETDQTLSQVSLFIPESFAEPTVGDTVSYDIYDGNSKESSFSLEISESNKLDWQRLLASKVNGWYEQFKPGEIFVGAWHQEMNHYMYFKNDQALNYLNAKNSNYSGFLSVTRKAETTKEQVIATLFELSQSDSVVTAGQSVVVKSDASVSVQQTQGTDLVITNSPSKMVLVDTASSKGNETITLTLTPLNGSKAETELSFNIIHLDKDGDQVAITNPDSATEKPSAVVENESTWDSKQTYIGGEIVKDQGSYWIAQWWVRGGDNPAKVYDDDVWGVWRPKK